MKFFEGCKPQVYFDGGKLFLEKKTNRKMWRLDLVFLLDAQEVIKCDDVILANYAAIETIDNRMEEIVLTHEIASQAIEFFGLRDHTAPLLYVKSELTDLVMTRKEGRTELHAKIELASEGKVDHFCCNNIFTLLWATFTPYQMELPMGPKSIRQLPPEKGRSAVN